MDASQRYRKYSDWRASVSRKIRQFRRTRDITQERLAREFSVSRATVSHWENGRAWPDKAEINKLVLLGMDASDFVQPPHLYDHTEQVEDIAPSALTPYENRAIAMRYILSQSQEQATEFWRGIASLLPLDQVDIIRRIFLTEPTTIVDYFAYIGDCLPLDVRENWPLDTDD